MSQIIKNSNQKLKKFYAFDDKPPIFFREGTSDEAIIQTVLIKRKEYLFPNFSPKVVFDIGANIGVTAVILANIYPHAKIHSFEPESENFALLQMNTEKYPNVVRHNCALGNKSGEFSMFHSEDPNNLGGFSTHILGPKNMKIRAVRMATICEEFGEPELIKIDCEGAEYDILTDIPKIEKVKWITGELHGVNDFNLLAFLSQYFRIQTGRNFYDKVWHFQAVSKSWADFGRDPIPQ